MSRPRLFIHTDAVLEIVQDKVVIKDIRGRKPHIVAEVDAGQLMLFIFDNLDDIPKTSGEISIAKARRKFFLDNIDKYNE